MQDSPEFDSTARLDDELTGDEQAAVNEGMRRLAEARESEDDVPDLDDFRRG